QTLLDRGQWGAGVMPRARPLSPGPGPRAEPALWRRHPRRPRGAAGAHGAGDRDKGIAAAQRAAAAGGGTAGATGKLPVQRLRQPAAAAALTPRHPGTARRRWDIT